jgi:lysophospholipase L1-like esterase
MTGQRARLRLDPRMQGLLIAAAAALAALYWFGWRPAHAREQRAEQTLSGIQLPRASDAKPCRVAAQAPRPIVLLALGQSNAGNHGQSRGGSAHGSVWVDGRCYAIRDPLPGGTGSGGSLWSRLAVELANDDLTLIVLGVDATSVSDWTGGNAVRRRLDALLQALQRDGVRVSAVLWQQGESDARTGTTRDIYAERFTALVQNLRQHAVAAPIIAARSTRCRNDGSADVRDAIADVARREPGVHVGPDFDALDASLRSDGCHFSTSGLARGAALWHDALSAQGIVPLRQ